MTESKINVVDKWISKYMKMAKALADDNRACYSRKIGVILMSDDNVPIGFGYNGSISKAPHNDDARYLAHLWNNLLEDHQKEYLTKKYKLEPAAVATNRDGIHCDPIGESFVEQFDSCKTCPRKLLDLPSGTFLELCNCAHAERNAIANAAKRGASTNKAIMYCWCGVPCFDCSSIIAQAGIKTVVCLYSDLPDYSKSSRGLLKMGQVDLQIVKQDDVLNFTE
jgi:deoxycytidylate deaminase